MADGLARLGRAVDGRVRPSAPAERLAVVRVLVVTYSLVWMTFRAPHLLDLAELPSHRHDPVGVLEATGWRLTEPWVIALLSVGVISGVAMLAGRAAIVAGPGLFVAALALSTHASSWSQVFHTENLMVLHLGVLALAPCADSLVAGRRSVPRAPDPRYGAPLRLMAVATVGTYVLAGWAKLDAAGLHWLRGDNLRNQVAYDNVRKILLDDASSPLAGWFVRHDLVFVLLAVVTLAVELAAPVALLGGRWRATWVAAAVAFHVGILALMAIVFPYQLTGVAYASMFPAERLAGRSAVRAWIASRSSRRSSGRAARGPFATGSWPCSS